MLRELLFWAPAGALAWVYAGYPLAAALAAAVRPFRVQRSEPTPELVTVGIPVHNEEHEVEARVRDVLEQEVPFRLEIVVGSDGSTDGTEAIVRRIAETDARVRLLALPRRGTTATQNAILDDAGGAIVALTDAATRYMPGSLSALIEPFGDPRVGCVTGRLRWSNETATSTSEQEGLYWRYEQVVRRLESRAGWLSVVTGAVVAIRRSVYRPVPEHTALDGMLPLLARDVGLVVVAVPEAGAMDINIAGLDQQLRNRARIATHGIRAILVMAGRLTPWRRPSAFLAVWSHKLLRWGTPWLVLLSASGAVLLVLDGQTLYLVPIAAGTAFIGLAAFALVSERTGHRPPRWAAFPLSFVIANTAFMIGWLNLIRRKNVYQWHRAKWQAR
jgi:cellulose synthase/poly-beta-1,6-N-acetylglucosamine synthase-like glycosyltransferase